MHELYLYTDSLKEKSCRLSADVHTHQGLSAVRAHFPGLQSVLNKLLGKKSVVETMKTDSSSFGKHQINTASPIIHCSQTRSSGTVT